VPERKTIRKTPKVISDILDGIVELNDEDGLHEVSYFSQIPRQ
jgi:hypothetical protein